MGWEEAPRWVDGGGWKPVTCGQPRGWGSGGRGRALGGLRGDGEDDLDADVADGGTLEPKA